MRGSRSRLAIAGMALAVWAMSYGFYYAVWVEHQTLDGIGGALANTFERAARRDAAGSQAALDQYARAKYNYTREVDAHSHWIGLAMILLILSAMWERLGFGEPMRRLLTWLLITGSVVFPLGVLLQKYLSETAGKAVPVAGAGLLIAGFLLVMVGFGRRAAA